MPKIVKTTITLEKELDPVVEKIVGSLSETELQSFLQSPIRQYEEFIKDSMAINGETVKVTINYIEK
ncbi:hypothetical protein [Terribacillus sp. JSM ZJ617]|uniref:hypothetical protein n=1 Tax=Terribacillus sp. JSM ZJ617 TaxID=3342119 RepID=UPI0035A8E2C3